MSETKNYNESELLQRIAGGDHSAFRMVFDHYRNKIFTIAFKLLKDESQAHDAIQEVFTKIWLHKEELPGVGNFNAFLNSVTRNYLFNQLKKLAYTEALQYRHEAEMLTSRSALDKLEESEINFHLAHIIGKLPPQQKRVYQLGKIQGFKYEEIAQELHVSKETVKSHMSEALRFIRRQVLQHEQFFRQMIIAFLLAARIISDFF